MLLAGGAALVAAMGFAAPVGAGKVVFSDDFKTSGVFMERWKVGGGRPGSIVCKNGALRLPGGHAEWKGQLPLEFVAEVTLVNCPAWAERPDFTKKAPRWAGISSDYGCFSVSASGGTAMLFKIPGWRNTRGSYRPIAGFELGRPVRLRLERRLVGTQMRYLYFVNEVLLGDYLAPNPRETRNDKGELYEKPFTLSTLNLPVEFEDVRIYEVSHANDSPNTVPNASFEYDEDDMPTHVQFPNSFNWRDRPSDEYESAFLKTFRIDRGERHSGRQSLRVNVSAASDRIDFRPFGAATAKGASGVFSAWMKATKEGLPVTLRYGGAKRTVTVSTDWRRYEVVCPSLSDPGVQCAAGVAIKAAGWEGTSLWVDDWQAELVAPPKGGFGFAEGKTYASPFRVSSTDAIRFARKSVPSSAVPCTAPAKTAAEAALRGYPLESGKTLVLGRLDFYTDEPEAKFRVWDEKGRLAEVALDITKMPLGTNAVTVKAHGRAWPATVVKFPKTPGATQVNHFARAIVHEGRPLVFSGLCSTTKPMMWGSKDGKYPQLDFLASRGFRHFHLACWDDRKQVLAAEQILRLGAEKGFLFDLWTDTRFGRKPDLSAEEAWTRLSQPNVCAHQVLDEPELGLKSEEAYAYLAAAHARYPYGCVMMNNCTPGTLAGGFGKGATDVFMLDNYLTNNPDGRTVDSVVSSIDGLRRVRPGTPCWYFLVNDNMTLHYKNPSYGEQVAQSWGTICAGGTGLSWYIGFPSTEPTWRAIVDVNREVQELADDLLSEELCGEAGASEPTKRLRVLTRKRGGAVTVFTCNIDAAPLKKVKFVLPPEARQNGTVEVLYENRTLKAKGGVFFDAFAGHSRHVYRVK